MPSQRATRVSQDEGFSDLDHHRRKLRHTKDVETKKKLVGL